MDWILTCDRYFDGTSFVERPTRVEISEGRITSISPRSTKGQTRNSSASQNGHESQADRAHAPTLIPGLMDGHAHVMGYASRPAAGRPYANDENHLRLLLCNGVTTVRDAGNSRERVQYLKWWSEKHDGPTLFPTSPVLSVPPFEWTFTHITETPEAARRTVRAFACQDLTTVALHHHLSTETVRAAINEAQRHGLRTAADVEHTSPDTLLDAGVNCIERLKNLASPDHPETVTNSIPGQMRRWGRLDLSSDSVSRLIDRLVESEVFVTTGLLVIERWCSVDAMIEEPHLEYMTTVMPAAEKMLEMREPMGMMMGKQPLREALNIPDLSEQEEAEVQAGLDTLRRFTHRLVEAGGRLVVGTDTPKPSIVPGFSVHQEMELLVNCGVSPANALRAATRNPAAMLQERPDGTGRRGVIEEGQRADLLLVDGNPAEDITTTRNLQMVLKGGAKVDRQTLFSPVQAIVDAL